MSSQSAAPRNYRVAPEYTCETCGTFNDVPGYALAHWFKPVLHTCPACLAIHELHAGAPTLKVKGNPKI